MFSGTAGRRMGKSSTGKSKISEIILNIQHVWNNLKSKNTRNIWKISHFTGCRQVYDNRISRQPGRGTLVITQPTTEDIGEFFVWLAFDIWQRTNCEKCPIFLFEMKLWHNFSNEETVQFEHWRRVEQLLLSKILKNIFQIICFWQTSNQIQKS